MNCGPTTKPCPCGEQVPIRIHHHVGNDHHYSDRRGVDKCLEDIVDAITREGLVVETASCNQGRGGRIGLADGRMLQVEFTDEWFSRGKRATSKRRART